MALWNGVGQVASVAQLAGVDAYGLIKMIVEAVQTVRRNKDTCQKLARRAEMIRDLLQQLQEAPLMQHRDTRKPMEQLELTLQRAYLLITSCQGSSFMYHCFTGANKADQFREVENDIAFFLQLFPLVDYVDTTRTWMRHLNRAQPSHAEESVQEMQTLNDHSSNAIRHEGTAEAIESRVQRVMKHGSDKEDQVARNSIFYEQPKQKLKMQSIVNKELVKLFCAEKCFGLLMFSFSQIVDFTGNFKWDNVIGRGAFGYVYKGKLPNGIEIAVKRHAAISSQGLEEFTAEIDLITNLQHKNVVRLLGFCLQKQKDILGFQIQGLEMILVYEYMPNKSLASFLYSYTKTEDALNLPMRLRIIEGLAQGLVYLHEHSRQCVVHMDLKASNILLDYEMAPKISDFGMAQVLPSSSSEETSTIVKGTNGYIDPEYVKSGKYSVKSDVYSFSILILEIISRKRCCQLLPNGDMLHLPTRAWELCKAGKSHELPDLPPSNEIQLAQIIKCVHVALLCIQDCPTDRPTMSEVLLMLHSDRASSPVPNLPANHTHEYPADVVTLETLWEANVPLQPHLGDDKRC
ncbi:hypothetical protein EJB05_49833, partial [Eragrostis curvula]